MRRLALSVVCAVACGKVTVNMGNLACDNGICAPGYFCDAATNICVSEGARGDSGQHSGDTSPGDPRPGDPTSGDPRLGDPREGDPEPGDPEQGDPEQGDPEQGDPRPGDPRPGDPRPGDPRPGEPRPGDPVQGDPALPITHIQRVQHGTTTLADGSASANATALASMDPSSSILFFNVAEGANAPADGQVSGQIASTTSIAFERVGSGGDIEIAWHVAEFASGVSVQRGRTVKPADTPVTETVTLVSSVNLGSSFVLATVAFAGGGFGANDWHRFYLSDASTLTIDAPGAGSDQGLRVNWQVVEVIPGGADAQCGTTTLNGTSTTVSFSPVQLSRSFLVFSQGAANETVDQILVQGGVTSATQAVFERDASGSDLPISYCVIEWIGATVRRGVETFGSGELVQTASLGASINLQRSVVFLSGYMRQGTTAYTADDIPGTGWFATSFADDQSVTIRRGSSASDATAAWTVVEFPP